MNSKFGNVVLHWSDTPRGRFGDGVSRPRPDQKTRTYRVQVTQSTARPMTVTMAAPDRRSALRYARNRWPGAEVEVLG